MMLPTINPQQSKTEHEKVKQSTTEHFPFTDFSNLGKYVAIEVGINIKLVKQSTHM